MRYIVATPPAEYPIDLNTAKEHLRLSSVSLGSDITTQQTIRPAEWAEGPQAGASIEVLGKRALVNLNTGTLSAGASLAVTVKESPDNIAWTNVYTFPVITTANDNAIYEYEYDGVERYLKADGVLTGAGADVARYAVEVVTSTPYSAEDGLLTSLIAVATDHTETYLRKRLVTQELELHLDEWPTMPFNFLWSPLQSVDTITYYDQDGVSAAFTDYEEDLTGGRMYFSPGKCWPTVTLQELDGVVIGFTVGYGDAVDVPPLIKRAICILIAHLYENREMVMLTGAVPKEIPLSYHALLFPYRGLRFN